MPNWLQVLVAKAWTILKLPLTGSIAPMIDHTNDYEGHHVQKHQETGDDGEDPSDQLFTVVPKRGESPALARPSPATNERRLTHRKRAAFGKQPAGQFRWSIESGRARRCRRRRSTCRSCTPPQAGVGLGGAELICLNALRTDIGLMSTDARS
jgi:hypothetical protein